MEDFKTKYGVSPYTIIGISKQKINDEKYIYSKYKKKALALHPDKTGQKTVLEFQILQEAFSVIKKRLQQIKLLEKQVKNQNKKKEDYKPTQEIKPEKNESKYEFFLENRMKPDTRLNKKVPSNVKYDPSLPSGTQYAKVDNENFNKTFDYYNQKYKDNKEIIPISEIKAVKEKTDLNYSNVYYYNGILITALEEKETEKHQKRYKELFSGYNPTQEEYEKDKQKIKQFKGKKVEEKKVVSQKYNPNIDVNYTETYSDQAFVSRQLQEQYDLLEKNKNRLENDPRISNRLLKMAKSEKLVQMLEH